MAISNINLGIIGAGRMGITHFAIINSHPQVTVNAIADSSGFILNLMKKHLSGLSVYKDYIQLLENNNIHAVLVCTPPDLHYEIIKKCALKGIHVFVEKPFTINYQNADELSALFNEKGLINQVGYVNRFNDVFLKTKNLLDNNLIGNVIRFKSEMFSCTVLKSNESSGWRATHESGGGAVFEMATHAIDLVNYLIGAPDKVVGSSLNNIFSSKVEDAISSTFLYRNGMSGTIYINWSDESYRKPTNKIEIFGLKGKILADQHSLKIYLKEQNKEFNFRKGWNTLYITDIFKPVPFYVRGNEFTRQLYHFVDCVLNHNERNLCPFSDGAKTLKVVESIFIDYEKNGRI